MDSKVVNKYIREIIRPELKANGFSKFTTRNSWRYRNNIIDVINFQSFNSYNADVMGVTTYSFCLNLGSFHLDIPTQYTNVKNKSGYLCPQEYECHFRGGLDRTIKQKEINRKDIWYIRPDGTNIEKCLNDAKQQIVTKGFEWFSYLNDKETLKNILLTQPESMGKLWGFGRNPSPVRSYFLGYVELILGNKSEAKKYFEKVIESGCYSKLFKTVEEAVARASNNSLN